MQISTTVSRQKFDNHALVVTQVELQRWKQLGIQYMSDEYDDEDQDPQLVVVHQPVWRSKRELKSTGVVVNFGTSIRSRPH